MVPKIFSDHELIIQCDASDARLVGVIYQVIGGEEKVIEFASHSVSSTERNYYITERECLCVLLVVEKFRCCVEGLRLTVVTDYSSLQWLYNYRDPSCKLARWELRLQSYVLKAKLRKGKLNVVPDALSQMYKEDNDVNVLSSIILEPSSDTW